MFNTNRRGFLKGAATVGAGLAFSDLGFNVPDAHAVQNEFKLINAKEYTSICTFCACGCGMIGYVKDGKLINLEGDSTHIVSEGGLCSKGASMSVIPNSEGRVKTPLYRAPMSNDWVEISWDEALSKVAQKIKDTRDKDWIENEKINGVDYPVKRCDTFSFIGGAQVHNEECYLMTKMSRLFGAVYVEHQARLCHSSTVPALSASFGRGAMTNSWNDLQNAKVILIEGSNAAENHPLSMKWVMRAKAKGAKVIHVDPRFNRTSKIADIFAQIRPGTDIAFLGSIINYIIKNELFDAEFLATHTNAFYLLNDKFSFKDGLFAGFSEQAFKYDTNLWNYQLDEKGIPKKTTDLQNPNCVFETVRDFYSRYSFEVASSITGIPEDKIKLIAETFAANRPGTVMYALGMTQHTVGVQNIRSFGVLQLLLGNVGKPGSGVNALRGEPNVQGSTDFAVLFNYLPGYLSYPNHDLVKLDSFTKAYGTGSGKYIINLLKSWFGDNANSSNGYCYSMLPKKNGTQNYSIYRIFETSIEGKMKFAFIMGQNPAVTNPNLNLVYKGLDNLDMLVVADPFLTETACFWERPGVDPKNIKTEVIVFPAASFLEKDGTITNSSRMVQWRYAGLKPVGESKPDLEILDLLYSKVRELYSSSNAEKDAIFKKAAWDYPKDKRSETVLKEINGYDLKSGNLLSSTHELKDDGSTSSGTWIYAGVFAGGKNLCQRRDNLTDPSGLGLYHNYSWTWPNNMRILYNRASCDKTGTPYPDSQKLVWWDASKGLWTGYDTPDVPSVTDGPSTDNGQRAFYSSGEGVGRLFAGPYKQFDSDGALIESSYVAIDGPMPEFYEPIESPTENIMHPNVKSNPCVKYPRMPSMQMIGSKKDFPYVLCTSSISEQWCGGTYTRNVPWLNELVQETYIEIPVQLAEKLGIKSADKVKVSSARGEVNVRAMVTDRMQKLKINGEDVDVVWMPYNWGFKGLSTAASTNLVTIDAGDPNTWIQETKACLVNIYKLY